MKCPHCKQDSTLAVRETRLRDGDVVRRRQCSECGGHFGTRERIDPNSKIGVRGPEKPVRKAPKAKPANPLFGGVWK